MRLLTGQDFGSDFVDYFFVIWSLWSIMLVVELSIIDKELIIEKILRCYESFGCVVEEEIEVIDMVEFIQRQQL